SRTSSSNRLRGESMDAPSPRYDPDADTDFELSDVEYARIDGEPFLARVYQPRGTGPFPALLDFHGGAWSVGSRATDEVIHRALAASGILVFAPDFRLAPTHPYPASIADTNLATRWLKAH